jgi:predicted MFS family arabinose efflux permease
VSKATTSDAAELQPLSGTLITLMSIAIGVIVANLYYLQPLLHEVTKDFHISESKATLLLVLIQAGYACGLAFVVPLGDLIPRRRLAVVRRVRRDHVLHRRDVVRRTSDPPARR